MAQQISAEEGALKAGATAVNEAKSKIDGQLSKVRGEIDQLSSFWTGAAAGQFTQLLVKWDEESSKLNNVLVTLEDALTKTERDQAAEEEAHQQTITGLSSIMGA